MLPNIKEIINKHWHILSINSRFKRTFNDLEPMIASVKKHKLKTTYMNKYNKKQIKISQIYKKATTNTD